MSSPPHNHHQNDRDDAPDEHRRADRDERPLLREDGRAARREGAAAKVAPERHTGSVQEAFGIVLFVVVGVAALVALVAFAGSGNVYRQIGRGGLSMDRDEARHAQPPGGSAAALAERDDEVRQMLRARNARRADRGETELDVEAELTRLTAPPVRIDPALEGEIRQLVIASNERRARQGRPSLDVDDEVARRLRKLEGG
jgi:hypothetical protein